MAAKAMRRLANDHGYLHKHGLPPNYLFPPNSNESSDMTVLSVLLAGPDNTPYSSGVFRLTLHMEPGAYPAKAPTATFRTKIFHPNVDPTTGAVCVDTLKRDWTPELTLRDVLVTISCLLVCPNPASALNGEAGKLMEEEYGHFEKRAAMWTRMYALTPPTLKAAVDEAKQRVVGEQGEITGKVIGRGKKRRDIVEDEQPTTGTENTRQSIEGDPMEGVLHTPAALTTSIHQSTSAQDYAVNGLGVSNIDISLDSIPVMSKSPTSESSKRLSRKRYAMLPPDPQHSRQSITTTTISDNTQTTTITHTHPSYISTSISSTITQAPEPPPKRRRTNSLTPPIVMQKHLMRQNIFAAKSLPRLINPLEPPIVHEPRDDPFNEAFEMPWLEWENFLPPQSRRDPNSIIDRRTSTLGSSITTNSRTAGPRLGIFRL
ncbi:UBC-like protein [Microthyrium microscopicum]|uniref:UBC-like protein n=1 Tax=Microthyrium microscopicum TaxID=703497 RepID=A0A6A6U736_9PEZI|nr:UBC-like protein [Microthyrium microscopicum]